MRHITVHDSARGPTNRPPPPLCPADWASPLGQMRGYRAPNHISFPPPSPPKQINPPPLYPRPKIPCDTSPRPVTDTPVSVAGEAGPALCGRTVTQVRPQGACRKWFPSRANAGRACVAHMRTGDWFDHLEPFAAPAGLPLRAPPWKRCRSSAQRNRSCGHKPPKRGTACVT